MDSFDINQAREDRGHGIPLTDEERQVRHGSSFLPPRGTGLNSIGLIQSLGNPGVSVDKTDVIGLLGGAAVGWLVAKKWPNMIVKYVGIVVGAELGILAARMIKR